MDAPSRSGTKLPLHRTYSQGVSPAARANLKAIAAQTLWLALAGAWLELAVLGIHAAFVGDVTHATYRMHRYHVPLNFAGHLAIFGAWFALTAVAWARGRRWRWLDRLIAVEGLFLAFASPLLAIQELYWPCALVLALAAGVKLAPWWTRNRAALLRRTQSALVAASALVAIGTTAWTGTREARALFALPPAPARAPNVVLLVLDTVRADHLSLYGYARSTTPFLESLAARSIVFDAARSPAPWTLPAHASMFTGRWHHELSVDADRPLDGSHPTIAEGLARAGYPTGGFTGNTSYMNAWFGVDRGFGRFDDTEENKRVDLREVLRSTGLGRALMPLGVRAGFWKTTGALAERRTAASIRSEAVSWIDSRPPGRPFFAFLNFFDAHDPYELPAGVRPAFTRASRDEVLRANRLHFQHLRPGGERAKAEGPTKIVLDVYDDCLRYLDSEVAALFADLERRRLLANTWVIVTADHGEHFGEHGRAGHGNSLYRPVIDIPLMIVPPVGQGSPLRVPVPVSTRDLAATIADLAGLDGRPPFPGRSLRRFWDGAHASAGGAEEGPLSEVILPLGDRAQPPARRADRYDAAVIDGDRILIKSPSRPDELYDAGDRPEATNLAPRPEEAGPLERLNRRLEERRRGHP